jgi:hypothetical protein
MTKEEKKDRRDAKHEVQAALKRLVVRRMGLFSTGPQIRAAIKVLSDRYYAEQVNPVCERIVREASHVE